MIEKMKEALFEVSARKMVEMMPEEARYPVIHSLANIALGVAKGELKPSDLPSNAHELMLVTMQGAAHALIEKMDKKQSEKQPEEEKETGEAKYDPTTDPDLPEQIRNMIADAKKMGADVTVIKTARGE